MICYFTLIGTEYPSYHTKEQITGDHFQASFAKTPLVTVNYLIFAVLKFDDFEDWHIGVVEYFWFLNSMPVKVIFYSHRSYL